MASFGLGNGRCGNKVVGTIDDVLVPGHKLLRRMNYGSGAERPVSRVRSWMDMNFNAVLRRDLMCVRVRPNRVAVVKQHRPRVDQKIYEPPFEAASFRDANL